MTRRAAVWIVAVILAAVALAVVTKSGAPRPALNPPGSFSFAALGDAPYFAWEEPQYRLVLRALDANDLAFVVHVGDIFWRPCTDEHYRKTLGRFNELRHPVIYTPGDNEWTDCWEAESGGFAPLGRLDRIRRIFFAAPALSLGGRRLPLISQGPEFVENVRWTHQGIVFATVHLVGSMNAMRTFPERTAADDIASRRRTEAATGWLRATFAQARESRASAVVIAFHADPSFEEPVDDADRRTYEPFMTALEEEVEQFGKPVLVVHGDSHRFTVDHPLTRRTTGRRLASFTRMEVPGSPDVGWVRVVVTPGASKPFVFENHVVPRWKIW
jgi:hypothetical protein